jgi:hypothetical protein
VGGARDQESGDAGDHAHHAADGADMVTEPQKPRRQLRDRHAKTLGIEASAEVTVKVSVAAET